MKKKVLSLLMTLTVVFGMAPAAIMADEGNTIAMKNMTVGGATYYYAEAAGAAEDTAFTFSVTTGRGASATTTNYSYTKAELNAMLDESEADIAAGRVTDHEELMREWEEELAREEQAAQVK